MKPYATVIEYKKLSNVLEEDKDIEIYLELASIKINESTLTRIEKRGFNNLTQNQQNLIKKATILQADYLYEQGVLDDDEIQSYSIGGDVTISKKAITDTIADKMKLSKTSYLYLTKTGLMPRII